MLNEIRLTWSSSARASVYCALIKRPCSDQAEVGWCSRSAAGTIVLVLIFPSFVAATREQGASSEVIERLSFFEEMNEMRAVFRMIYAISFVSNLFL